MSKYIELGKKLKALADRGEGGEKYNAEQQLKKLMRKHGFTIEDIDGEKFDHHYFKVLPVDEQLFFQVNSTIHGSGSNVLRERGKRNYLVIETTTANAVELEAKFAFYLKAYKEKLQIFFSAFIHANSLYPKGSTGKDASELSEKELERFRQAQRLAQSIETEEFYKQLSRH